MPTGGLASVLLGVRRMKQHSQLVRAALVVACAVGACGAARAAQRIAGTATGHAIGVVGGVLLVVVFVYPVRKYWLRQGRLADWLRWHMVLGLVAPLLVLAHGALRLHALLPALATAAMVLCVVSGLVGRYLVAGARRALRDLDKQLRDEGRSDAEREQSLLLRASSVRAMANWRAVHYPIAALFLALAVAHVATALYFGGL